MFVSKLFWTFAGPRLYRVYMKDGLPGYDYNPGLMEQFPDKMISSMFAMYGMVYWTSPFLSIWMYKKGYFSNEGFFSMLRLFVSIATFYSAAHVIRGIGRLSNAEYRGFIDVLVKTWKNPDKHNKKMLANYDFEFWAWPVDFKWNQGDSDEKKKSIQASSTRRGQAVEKTGIICRVLGWLAIHSFGKAMIYPGATGILNYLVFDHLKQGRRKLVEEKGAQRAKLVTEEGNQIDTMFLDRRAKAANGAILVITCEGNGGFLEMGCSETPISKNYSVLSWNHPGFSGSTGTPYPKQEQNAIDTVIQYAIHSLGFQPQNIGVFAWSIGGYTATWAGKTYPDLKFLILDATFDDLVPLAVTKMPAATSSLVGSTIRNHFDLNIADNLKDYGGPFLLIRRTRDEMICTKTTPHNVPILSSNRGNNLLMKVLQHRYPRIVDQETIPVMEDFLKLETPDQATMLERYEVNYQESNVIFTSYIEEHGLSYPLGLSVGHDMKVKLALFLITVHMENFVATHCTELNRNLFHLPWQPGQPRQH